MDNTDITTEITVVVDTSSVIGDEFTGSGLSLLIERTNDAGNEQILFDTGLDGDVLLKNLDELFFDIEKIGNIFLSSGHADHIGGLSALLGKTEQKPRLFCNEKIFREKISGLKIEDQDAGITAENNFDFIPTGDAVEIIPGLWTVSDSKDEVDQESSIVIEAAQDEIILIAGCGNSGIMNLLELIRERYPKKQLIGIIGSMGFQEKSSKLILEDVEAIKNLELLFFCPIYNTGDKVLDIFEKELGDVFVRGGVGIQIVFS